MTGYASIYVPGDVPTVEWLSRYPGVTHVEIVKADDRQIRLTFLDSSLTINVMPEDEVKSHLRGFANYVMSLHVSHRSDATHSLLERIAKTKNVLGCVIEPEFDNEGLIGGLLTAIAYQSNGLMFARDCVFDSDGTELIKGTGSH